MALKNLFGRISLQVSVMSFAFGFMNLAWNMLLVNISDRVAYPHSFKLVVFAALIVSAIWGSALYGAIKESFMTLALCSFFWLLFIIIWSGLVLASFVEETGMIFINFRGPESMWLVYNKFNNDIYGNDYEYYYHYPHLPADEMFFKLRSSADSVDYPLEPPTVAALSRPHLAAKWLLTAVSAAIIGSYLVGSLYVLMNYCSEVKCLRDWVCPEVCADLAAYSES